MTETDADYTDVRFSIQNNLLKINFESEFGEISLTLNLDALQSHLLNTISNLFDGFVNDDPAFLSDMAGRGISVTELRRGLEAAIASKERRKTKTAVDKFLNGKDLHVQGLLEQVIDNLPAGIILLLSHLAITAIVSSVSDVPSKQSAKIRISEKELHELVGTHFKRSISRLWQGESNRASE